MFDIVVAASDLVAADCFASFSLVIFSATRICEKSVTERILDLERFAADLESFIA
jgi:hypothetical protein